MDKELLIYDKGELIGSIIGDRNYPKNIDLELLAVEINEKKYNVLHISDMDYGIVISDELTQKIKDIMKEIMENNRHVKNMKDFLNGEYGLNNKMEEK